jgi:uncharacterized membrane protein
MGYHKDNHFSNLDWVLIAINSVLFLFSWAYLIAWYPSLPEIIPVHFDVLGKPNGYSSKENIWFTPFLFTLLSVAFIFGAKYQEAITYPKRKIGKLERISNLKMMLFTALLPAVLCPIILYTMIEASIIENFEMPWIMPIIIGIVLLYLPVVLYYKFKTLKLS